MEWFDWFSVAAGSIALILAICLPIRDKRKKDRENDFHRNTIQDAIYDAEIIFRNVSSLSNDYDYTDEKITSERIAKYTRKNIGKVDYCMQDIKYHSAFLKLDKDMKNKIKNILDTLDWFMDFYYCDDVPTIKQNVTWKNEHDHLDEKIDRVF